MREEGRGRGKGWRGGVKGVEEGRSERWGEGDVEIKCGWKVNIWSSNLVLVQSLTSFVCRQPAVIPVTVAPSVS